MDDTLNMPDPTKVALVAWALAHAQAQPHDDLSAAIRERCPARMGWPDRTIRELAQWINEWQQVPRGNAGYWCSAACKSRWAGDYGDAVRAHRVAHPGISVAEAVQVLAQAQPG